MASLSTDDLGVIKDHPLGDCFDRLRGSLKDVEGSYSIVNSLDGADDGSDSPQDVISRLLISLMGTKAAFNLRSKISSRNVVAELTAQLARIQQGEFSYIHYRPLVKLVIQKASDHDIWSNIFEVIATLSRATPLPPTTVPTTFDSTPITHSSASQQGSEQTRRIIEERVFQEIRTCTYRDVKGFFEKYFEGKDWNGRARDVYESVKDQYVDGEWTDISGSPSQDQVLSWLFRLQDNFLSNEQCRYYTINLPKELVGGEAKRQVDLITKRTSGKSSDTEHNWRDIEVIGELKASEQGVKKPLVQLARYARDVFTYQPTRRYLHAFTICGSFMTAWVFDRSGCYSPGPFNIHKEPERFIQLLAGYTMMDEDKLGLDIFTEVDNDCRSICVEQGGTEIKLLLKPEPLTRQRAIVCRGTSCYLTKLPGSPNWNHVTKFSWTSDRRKPEVDLLRLASQRNVEGIAKLVGYRSITSVRELRSDLTFTKSYSFHGGPGTISSSSQSQLTGTTSRSFTNLNSLSITESTGRYSLRKRKSTDVGTKPSKRSRSASRPSNPSGNKVTYNVEEAQGTSLLAPSSSLYDNRILRCLVIFPAGRPIHMYSSPLELLEALRDAIKAHRSLYLEGRILHRDISENNIIITDTKATGFAGMLIDMDLAKELGSGPSGARCRTGTMEFMAIEVLLSIDHTYRHDLESFFYVLVWQCGRRGWDFVGNPGGRPENSQLTKWYTGDYDWIADSKRGNVDANGFERILAKDFPPEFNCVKPLCRELRGILFPIRGNSMFTGTPSDPELLYGPIIKAFDKAIDSLVTA